MVNYYKLALLLCQNGVLTVVFEAIFVSHDFRNQIIQISFEILWSCIEGIGAECLVVLAKQEYIWGIQTLFSTIVSNGYKLDDKCLRNELLILINYLLSLPEAVGYFLISKQTESKTKNLTFLELLFDYAIAD